MRRESRMLPPGPRAPRAIKSLPWMTARGRGCRLTGGGIRRCLRASVAELEMRVVLQAIGRHVRLRPALDGPEGPRRRAITLVRERDGLVLVA